MKHAAIDLFEILRNEVGAPYLSDLHYEPYLSLAQKKLTALRLENFPPAQLNDMANYLYSEPMQFANAHEAHDYFRRKWKETC